MKSKKIKDTTTNRGEFNRAYKFYLEQKGRIRCSYCKYHRSENSSNNVYWGDDKHIKYPNWKLVSKHPKQWMKKPMTVVEQTKGWGKWKRIYVEIKFST